MSSLVWIPARGPDAASLERMCRAFSRPAKAPGEAWFMGEKRRMFPDLMGDLRNLSADALDDALCEIASGPASFGPLAEWTDWYHYLLPRLISRAHETAVPSDLLEILVTGFVTQYPHGVNDEPYSGFRKDALATLGQCMMAPEYWIGDHPNLKLFFNRFHARTDGCWSNAGRKLSASLFFCIKYLDENSVRDWIDSVLAINSTHWRAQMLVWFVGACPILSGMIGQPSDFDENYAPQISWNWSHCLKGTCPDLPLKDFLPLENRNVVLRAAQTLAADDAVADLVKSMSRYEHLEYQLAGIPEQFLELYRTISDGNLGCR